MKRWVLVLLPALLLSACGLAPTPAPAAQTSEVSPTGTMSETSEVLPTPTPAPTETPTPTPPPEALARLEGRDWRIENNQVMVGAVVWYAQDAEGQWQPAPFVADFEKFDFSLDGLDIVNENGVARAIDPNATDEARRIVYEDGKMNILFAVDSAGSNCKPTKFIPVPRGNNHYWVDKMDEPNFKGYTGRQMVESGLPIDRTDSLIPVVIDHEKYCWGQIHERLGILFYRTIIDKVMNIPLMEGWFKAFFK